LSDYASSPRQPAVPDSTAHGTRHADPSPSHHVHGRSDEQASPRALLATSHWPLRELYRTILERSGYGVREVETGDGIIQQVAENPPDLVVVCADDPRVRGTVTVGQLVRDPRLKNRGTAFLALTTHDMRRSQMAEVGFTDCLTLPASIKEITATLEDIARRKFAAGPTRE
jgi:CheY-like chemotaxis protein